jgi:hypothetical protein
MPCKAKIYGVASVHNRSMPVANLGLLRKRKAEAILHNTEVQVGEVGGDT